MLQSFHVSNYALISKLDIRFDEGFTVLTGETGAGKSILLGALSLLLGQRADTKSILSGEDKCVVEAEFNIKNYKHLQDFFEVNELDYDPDICLIRRELNSNGKSRAFINDSPVSLQVLRDLTNRLVDIHSQHQNLLLSNASYQLDVLDVLAANAAVREQYHDSFQQWKDARQALEKLRREVDRATGELDFIRFQHQQLTDAALKEDEQESLEAELELLTHAELIKTELSHGIQLLSEEQSALPLMKEALQALTKIIAYLPAGNEQVGRLESAYIDMKDLCDDLQGFQDRMEFDPARLQEVELRLDELYTLQKKHKVTSMQELIELRERYALQLQHIDNFDLEIQEHEKRVAASLQALEKAAGRLSASRREPISLIETSMVEQLSRLGMPHIRFVVELNQTAEFGENGRDEVRFLFSANKNRPLQPVEQTASGGEMSRLMLSVKALIAHRSDLPTILFDEIDSGVSGEIAHRMSEIMREMSRTMQVITITHLPQIAAKGQHHFRVYKDESGARTETFIAQLSADERIGEIASMLSGEVRGEAALQNARELLSY